jgi:hypothetical protein
MHIDCLPMEWMLQVADEVDDAVSAARLFALGWSEEIGIVIAGGFAVCAMCAAVRQGIL